LRLCTPGQHAGKPVAHIVTSLDAVALSSGGDWVWEKGRGKRLGERLAFAGKRTPSISTL
jgi:hypothetical protein